MKRILIYISVNLENKISSKRDFLSQKYILGVGIEIGALGLPLNVSSKAKVKYVDRSDKEKLREQYPDLRNIKLVDVDIIDDGETLYSISESSQDFIIANHFLEHCQNPISTLKNMLRILKENGVLFLAIPNKNKTFDIYRNVTSFDHVLDDFYLGPESSRENHYLDWAQNVNKLNNEEAKIKANLLMSIDFSIHFHVWDNNAIVDFFNNSNKELHYPFNIECFLNDNQEFIVILRKKIAQFG